MTKTLISPKSVLENTFGEEIDYTKFLAGQPLEEGLNPVEFYFVVGDDGRKWVSIEQEQGTHRSGVYSHIEIPVNSFDEFAHCAQAIVGQVKPHGYRAASV